MPAVEGPGEARLTAGRGVDATLGEPLGPVREWGAGRIAEFEARTAVGR